MRGTHRLRRRTRERRPALIPHHGVRPPTTPSKAQQPCPSTTGRTGACPRYVVDHVKPLACGGIDIDSPENMQWQPVAEAKAKDAREQNHCGQPAILSAFAFSSEPYMRCRPGAPQSTAAGRWPAAASWRRGRRCGHRTGNRGPRSGSNLTTGRLGSRSGRSRRRKAAGPD